MALVGRPSAQTFLTFAENQAQSPWEPYRVSQGFAESDSTVSISVTGGYGQRSGTSVFGGGAVALVPPESVVQSIIDNIHVRGIVAASGGRSNFITHRKHLVLFNPEIAQELHERLGYTRESLQTYIYDRTSVPFEDLTPVEIQEIQAAIDGDRIAVDRVEIFKAGLKPGGKVPSLSRPEDVHMVVSGGIPGYTVTFSSYLRGVYKPTAHITKAIRGATLTDAGKTASKGKTVAAQ
jgi:hypothetical protein